MGRPKKFGEKSRFVSVRVPGSKVLEYREAIKKLVDEKFSQQDQKSQIPRQRSFPQVEKVNLDNETVTIEGICEGNTEKALLILFESGKEIKFLKFEV